MKNKLKRTISLVLTAAMIMSAPVLSTADEPTESGMQQSGTAIEDTVVSPDSVDIVTDAIADEDVPDLASLLPLKEVDAEIDLSDYLSVELKNFKVSDLLALMTDPYTGEPIEIDPNATMVWSNFPGEDGYFDYDVWEVKGMDDNIDLSGEAGTYIPTIELIVGSGKQLDPGNVRYILDINAPDYESLFDFQVWAHVKDADGNTVGMPIPNKLYTGYEYIDFGDGTYKNIRYFDLSVAPQYSDLYIGMAPAKPFSIKVYEGKYDSPEEATASGKDITASIVNSVYDANIEDVNKGYTANWDDEDVIITIVYEKDGKILGSESCLLYAYPRQDHFEGRIFPLNNTSNYVYEAGYLFDLEPDYPYGDSNKPVYNYIMRMYSEYPADAEYNLNLDFYSGELDKVDNSRVIKAVEGHYFSLEEAAEQPDIKDALFNAVRGEGYKANYSGAGVKFTIFTENDIWNIVVSAVGQGSATDNYDDSPNIGSSDRYFRVTDLYDGEGINNLDTYVIPYSEDTYYSNGYQTLLINDTEADLSNLVPNAYIGENASVFKDGVREETDSENSRNKLSVSDFSKRSTDLSRNPDNSVRYTVSAENKFDHKNYWITAVKKENGPKLFVNGPDEREIFLNNYFDNSHDIFIANIGTEELKNINVTLNATNVKLDDYWTIGGDGNNSLAPFETTYDNSGNYYGELFNVAKVRLIPDGEGEIKGTLTITADGQTPKVITLKGTAGNPKIDTTSIPEAVKYVPYSTIITTNNMHDWNRVRFRLVDGKLPEGMELYPSGEIYGVPKEAGEFPIKVAADFSHFSSSIADFVLKVNDNTDEFVDGSVDEGYGITIRVPDFTDDMDRQFEIEGALAEFMDFWLDGQKLEKDNDYTAEEGSTKITIKSQTFTSAGDGKHTIAAEFRVNGDRSKDLKKASQNYTRGKKTPNGNGGGGGGGSSSGKKYTVSYNSNGGSDVKSQNVSSGSGISFLATPEKPGYRFAGWYTDKELTKPYDKNSKVTSALMLYAKWEQVQCTVWFDTDGGSEAESVKIMGDTALDTLPVSTKEGYNFEGWFTDDGLQFNAGDKIYANTTLHAKWTLVIPEKAPDEAKDFIDVDENAWYYNDAQWAYANKYMIGYNNAIFAPMEYMTMSNIVTVMAKMTGADVSVFTSAVSGIQEGMWYTPYAKWAASTGIVNASAFAPNMPLSRENMCVILKKYLDMTGKTYSADGADTEFADGSFISTETNDAVQILYKLGVLAGKGNNTVDPKGTLTRAEFAAFAHRISEI